MLDELQVLVLELLAGSLQAIDLLDLGLLLGQGLTDDLARLGIGLVADAVGVLTGLGDDVIGRLLRGNERSRDLRRQPGRAAPEPRRAAARRRSGDS